MSLTTTKSEAWINRDKKVIAPCQHLSYYPLTVQKVEGEIIYDQDNNRFIDFLSSASSCKCPGKLNCRIIGIRAAISEAYLCLNASGINGC